MYYNDSIVVSAKRRDEDSKPLLQSGCKIPDYLGGWTVTYFSCSVKQLRVYIESIMLSSITSIELGLN